MDIFDAIVIGGGPAGATAAGLMASRGRRVLLLEQSHFPRGRLCGEFISPECAAIFGRLGVLDRIRDAGAQPIRRMDLIAPDGRRVKIPVRWFAGAESPAFGLTRVRLDAILLDRARELGAEVREGIRVSPQLERQASHFEIEGRLDGGDRQKLAARLIVDASGRGQLFERRPGQSIERPQARGTRLFGCKVHLRGVKGLGDAGELYFFREGYGGLLEVEPDRLGSRSNLCFLTNESTLKAAKGDRERLLELTLLTNPSARSRLQDAVFADGWLGAGPIVYGQRSGVPGVIAIGDAGAFIDPFTGSGILLALSSAELAASSVSDAFEADEMRPDLIARRYRQRHRDSIGWRFRSSQMIRRLALSPLGRKLLVPLVTRHEGLTRLLAQSTRARRIATLVPGEE